MKKYMLLMYLEENTALTEEQRQHCYVESAAFAQQLAETGRFLGAAPLQPTSTATSLRLNDGKRLITDGPFAETREQLGGFFLVNAKDLDEAIEICLPGARRALGDRRDSPGRRSARIAENLISPASR